MAEKCIQTSDKRGLRTGYPLGFQNNNTMYYRLYVPHTLCRGFASPSLRERGP